VWGLELSGSLQGAGGIGGLLSANINGTNLFYSYDANGNITEYITSTGEKSFALAAHYEYDPYGNTIAKTGTSADSNHFRFSTKHFDKDLSLYYYGYRYYNSELGRWINRDPIGEQGGFNVYGFVHNGVLDEYDLLGLRNDKRACCNKNRCT
jgi:RHS repeat-associated protein